MTNLFKLNKYCIEKSVISEEMLDFISQYAIFDELSNRSKGDPQVPNAHSKYGDPAMETLLLMLQPVIERVTNLSVYPTYSYYRVYRKGDELLKHIDRPSCEISATVSFRYSYSGDPWSIFMNDTAIKLWPGDIAVYRGCEVQHWRPKLVCGDTDWHVQGFFHYVDQNGPFSSFKFDQRQSIGQPKNVDSNKYYIQYLK